MEDKVTKNGYTIIPIYRFEVAKKYSDYVDWRFCAYKNIFDSYSEDGLVTLYICLKDGWTEAKKREDNSVSSFVEYGLSMLAVWVRADGKMVLSMFRCPNNSGTTVLGPKEDLCYLLGIDDFNEYFPAPKLNKEGNGTKVLLDDNSVTTVAEFDKDKMKAIGVQVYNNVYITLHDYYEEGANGFDWYKAQEVAEKAYSNSSLPSYFDFRVYYKNKKKINEALLLVGGRILSNGDGYWTSYELSDEKAMRVYMFDSHKNVSGFKHFPLNVRPFITIK